MGLCDKIFIINLQNLQMLFMSWIENKYSECQDPLHTQEAPKWKIFWRRFYPGRQTRGGNRGRPPQILFYLPNFAVLRKYCFEHMIKTKIFPPLKCIVSPQTLKPAQGLLLTKLCLQLTYIFEGHSASRCSITSKTYFINHHYRAPVSILGEGSELG